MNLGDDADTTGAVYGQIAGTYYGVQGIPEHWIDIVHDWKEISGLSKSLLEKSLTKLSKT